MLKRDNEAKTEAVRNLKMQLQGIEHQRLELLESQDKLARSYEIGGHRQQRWLYPIQNRWTWQDGLILYSF